MKNEFQYDVVGQYVVCGEVCAQSCIDTFHDVESAFKLYDEIKQIIGNGKTYRNYYNEVKVIVNRKDK